MWNIRRRCIASTYWFRPYAELLDSLRSPSGPAFGCYYASLRISSLAQKVTKEKARPASGFRCAQLPSLRCYSEGRHGGPSLAHRSSFGIHAKRPSPQHLYYSLRSPCGPACGCYSAALRFGLLTGFGDRVV